MNFDLSRSRHFQNEIVFCLPNAPSAADEKIPVKYRLDDLLTGDAVTETFSATNTNLDQPCVIMFFAADYLADAPHLRARLEREAAAAARIIHPHLVGVLDFGTLADDTFFIVTEKIGGLTLRDYLNESAAAPIELQAVVFARQAARGLAAAHRAGLLHRAVEPENIMVAADVDGKLTIKINNFDFGGIRQHCQFTGEFDSCAKTLKYRAPEQLAGRETDARADVYSLAVILREMLGGKTSGGAATGGEILQSVVRQPFELLRGKTETQLTRALRRSLRTNPRRRTPTANAFIEHLRHYEQLAARLEIFSPEANDSPTTAAATNALEARAVETRKTISFAPDALVSEFQNADEPPVTAERRIVNKPKNSAARLKGFLAHRSALTNVGLTAFLTFAVLGAAVFERHIKQSAQHRSELQASAKTVPTIEFGIAAESVAENALTLAANRPAEKTPARGWLTELKSSLDDWLEATNKRDFARQMNYYAQTVNAYYLARNASQKSVLAEKTRVFARARAVRLDAGEPKIMLSADGRSATMRFRKKYVIEEERRTRNGEVLQELEWAKSGDDWKIIAERDVKVLSR